MTIIWMAATVKPLNRRTVGTMEGMRNKIISKLSEDEAAILAVPKWWEDMLGNV